MIMKIKSILTVVVILAGMLSFHSCNQPQQTTQNPDPAHNSKLSLDWAGTYTGVLPCADCEGIATTIHLNDDETYEITMTYLGKEENNTFAGNGSFSWDESGNIITLEGMENGAPHYQVGENLLFQLDLEKNRIKGELAEMYILKKKMLNEEEAQLHNIYWKLIEVNGKAIPLDGLAMKEAHLKLDLLKMRAYGTGGCNNFFGGFEIPATGKIKFKPMASTMMACPDMETDKLLFNAFEKADAYNIADGRLSLLGEGKALAVFETLKE